MVGQGACHRALCQVVVEVHLHIDWCAIEGGAVKESERERERDAVGTDLVVFMSSVSAV